MYAVYKFKGPHAHQETTVHSYMLVQCLAAVWAIGLAIQGTSKAVGIVKGQILKTIMVADLVPLKACLFSFIKLKAVEK